MTISDLGGYGLIDDISLEELLTQKGVEDRTLWKSKKTGKNDWKFKFLTDQFGPEDIITIDLGNSKAKIPKVMTKEFTITNFIQYEVSYPCELSAVYTNPRNGSTGFSVRSHPHPYFDGKEGQIMEVLSSLTKEELAAMRIFLTEKKLSCVTLDVFLILEGQEDYASAAHLTYIPSIGPHSDISEWFEIEVFEGLRGTSIGAALEKGLLKQLKAAQQKLLVVNGIFPYAAQFYLNLGYQFYRFNSSSQYKEPQLDMPGHIMAKVLDPSIIIDKREGHLDWSKDPNQPRFGI